MSYPQNNTKMKKTTMWQMDRAATSLICDAAPKQAPRQWQHYVDFWSKSKNIEVGGALFALNKTTIFGNAKPSL